MNAVGWRRSVGRIPTLLLGLLVLVWGTLAFPTVVLAHALDEYLQASYITVAPGEIVVELNMTPGALLAPDVLLELDPDGDGQIEDADTQRYVDAVLRSVVLEVDGEALALELTEVEMPPYLNIQTGYGTIRIFATAALADGMTGTHQITYENNFAPTGSVYQVNAFVDKDVEITLGKQNRDSIQQTMTVDYAIGDATLPATTPTTTVATNAADATSATTASDTTVDTTTGAPEYAQRLLAYVQAPTLSPWVLLLGLALAAVLGGLHALTPGHGKTLVAAYLIGSRGTVRDAMVLGGTVTITHTASVLVFGALALLASQTVATTILAALLELCAALLVVGLGARLAWVRWRALKGGGGAVSHGHPHPHPHTFSPRAGRPSGLIGLGMAGGALPCPEALAIMLVAIGLGRIGLGLGLIVSFSFGLAAVLVALGVLLVRAEGRLKRWNRMGSAWQQWLPLGSAVIVFGLGAAMLFNVVRREAIPTTTVLVIAGVAAVFASGYGLALLLHKRRNVAEPQQAAEGASAPWLPPRYQGNQTISAAPMGAADLRFDETGAVAWDTIWTDFCDLAIAGGPPHRGTLLEAPTPEQVRADPEGYQRVLDELARGLRMVTDLPIITNGAPGWIGVQCDDEEMALWMLRAIVVENVAVRREGRVLFVPAGPDFRLEREIKNVVTVVAKTFHYWSEHRTAQQQ